MPFTLVVIYLWYSYNFKGFNTSFGPVFIASGFMLVYLPGGMPSLPLFIVGIILGIKGLKKGQFFSTIGIVCNLFVLVVGIYLIFSVAAFSLKEGNTNRNIKKVVLEKYKNLENSIFFDGTKRDGYAIECELSKDEIISGNVLPKGTRMLFNKNGRILQIKLGSNTAINGVSLPINTEIDFYTSGKIERLNLFQNIEVSGVKYESPSIDFFENGNIQKAWLLEDQIISNLKFSKGEMVEFHENGRIMYGKLAENQDIEGFIFPKDSWVSFDEKGNVAYWMNENLELSMNKTFSNILFLKGSKLNFSGKDKIKQVNSVEDISINGMSFLKGQSIYFYKTGELKYGHLAKDQEIQGLKLKKATGIGFCKSGRILFLDLYLTETKEFGGLYCPDDGKIIFDDEGNKSVVWRWESNYWINKYYIED